MTLFAQVLSAANANDSTMLEAVLDDIRLALDGAIIDRDLGLPL
jgi:hypothetical protein